MLARALALTAVAAALVALVALPAPAQAAATCQGARATIVGTPHGDVLRGTPGRDVIAGLGGADVLRGLGGSDQLCGGAGDDKLHGGADRHWHDQFQTIATGDRLDGGAGDDLLDPGPRITGVALVQPDLLVFAGADGVTVDLGERVATGQGHDSIVWRRTLGVVGSPGDDHLIGTDEPDRFTGKGGDDELEGLGGRDVLLGDRGDDILMGGPGPDELRSTGGADIVRGGGADDVISISGGGADDIDAMRGGDLVFLLLRDRSSIDGMQLAFGPPGDDPWDTNGLYVSSRDPIRARFTIDRATGRFESGPYEATLLQTATLNFSVDGSRLHYIGAEGADEVAVEGRTRLVADGRGGDDVLYGGPRDDRLIGGDGHDYVSGSGGTDTCDAERMRGCEA
jgi:Ca2+-binding RTX toxin-like protein